MQAKEWMLRPLNECKYGFIYVCCVAVVHGKLSQDNQWFKSLLHHTCCTHVIALTARQASQIKNTTWTWTFSQTKLTPKEKTSTQDWMASSNHTHTSIAIATVAAILINKYNESTAITTTTTKQSKKNCKLYFHPSNCGCICERCVIMWNKTVVECVVPRWGLCVSLLSFFIYHVCIFKQMTTNRWKVVSFSISISVSRSCVRIWVCNVVIVDNDWQYKKYTCISMKWCSVSVRVRSFSHWRDSTTKQRLWANNCYNSSASIIYHGDNVFVVYVRVYYSFLLLLNKRWRRSVNGLTGTWWYPKCSQVKRCARGSSV